MTQTHHRSHLMKSQLGKKLTNDDEERCFAPQVRVASRINRFMNRFTDEPLIAREVSIRRTEQQNLKTDQQKQMENRRIAAPQMRGTNPLLLPPTII